MFIRSFLCQAALIIGFLCFMCDFAGMFFGTSLFYNTVRFLSFITPHTAQFITILFYPQGNMFHILVHFIGGILLSWVVTYTWNYKALWPIVACCNIPTALYEIAILIGIRVLKIIVY